MHWYSRADREQLYEVEGKGLQKTKKYATEFGGGKRPGARALVVACLVAVSLAPLAARDMTLVLDRKGFNINTGTSIVLDSSGLPVVTYYDGTNNTLRVLVCQSMNCKGKNNVAMPDSATGVGMYSSVTLDNLGNPVVSYYDEPNGALKVLHCDDPYCEGDESGNIHSPDIGGGKTVPGFLGLFTSLVLDGTGNPVISYRDATNGLLKVLHCDDPNCEEDESGNITTPDTTGNVGEYASLALDGGNPVVAYFDVGNNDLKVLRCGDSTCSSGNTIKSPDTAGVVGRFLSMVLDGVGNPVISYHQASNGGALKVLHCGDPVCDGTLGLPHSTNSIATPDMDGLVGEYTSIKLDAAGNPVISYFDETNGALKFLHCGDANCAGDPSPNIVVTADKNRESGYDTSLVLDMAHGGLPLVVYSDQASGNLKLLVCDDPNCN